MIKFSSSLETIARSLGGSCRGDHAEVRCLVHDDSNPSLSLSIGGGGEAMWHCHAGCKQLDVQAALETRGLIRKEESGSTSNLAGIFERLRDGKIRKLLHTYCDARAIVIGHVARYEDAAGKKSYLPFFKREVGGKWKAGYPKDQNRVVYNLHLLTQHPEATVVLVEGEKCADALNDSDAGRNNFLAISWPGGARAWKSVDWSPLKNRRVILWPDNDAPGTDAMSGIRETLPPTTEVLGVVKPEKLGLGEGEDVADYLKRHPGQSQVIAPIFDKSSPTYALDPSNESQEPKASTKVLSLGEWLNEEAPEPDQIITDCFDAGDKVAIIGSSKTRKSFFTAQLALSIAMGREFAGLRVPKRRRVLIVQLELKHSHYHRRMSRHLRALNISVNDLMGGQLLVLNGRGLGIDAVAIQRLAQKHRPEVLIVDPLYKILEGDENSAEHFKRTLAAFDRIAEESGAAVIYVHHDKKNVGGETDVRDRGAGSGVLGRDYDCCLALSRHETSEDALVVQPLLRNYAPRKPVCIQWYDNCFVDSRLPPLAKSGTSRGSRREQLPDADYEALVHQLLNFRDETKSEVEKHLATQGATVTTIKRIIEGMIVKKQILVATQTGKRGGVKILSLPPRAPCQTDLTFDTGLCHVES